MSMLEDNVWRAMEDIYDPEIPVNIIDLGLIYSIRESPASFIRITMTVTTRYCPAAVFLPERVREAAGNIAGVDDVEIELVFEPRWTRERISPQGRKALGYS